MHIFLILILLLCGCSANVNSLGDGDNKDYTVSEKAQQPEDEEDSDDQETAYTIEDVPEYSGVEMEGWSVEDGGKGICFHVYCYNGQPEIEIDYATGEGRKILLKKNYVNGGAGVLCR